ncbi:MAG TPA: hypothetical protein VL550_09540 [Rhodocyclaceae bacterium]|jgi:hypothetical protein|nr:hypothetical protein [Rhodocyclaceae bacterium]
MTEHALLADLFRDDLVYEERCCLFLDVLGFSRLLKHSEASVVFHMLTYFKEGKEKFFPYADEDTQVTAFSDSIVISINSRERTCIHSMIEVATQLQKDFMQIGILTRGGIALGKMFHKDGILFGPAMVEAYTLESEIAVYPRVVVSEKAVIKYHEFLAEFTPVENQALADKFRRDFDGVIHVHIFDQTAYEPLDPQFPSFELELDSDEVVRRVMLGRPVGDDKETKRIQTKYDWLESYYYQSNRDSQTQNLDV